MPTENILVKILWPRKFALDELFLPRSRRSRRRHEEPAPVRIPHRCLFAMLARRSSGRSCEIQLHAPARRYPIGSWPRTVLKRSREHCPQRACRIHCPTCGSASAPKSGAQCGNFARWESARGTASNRPSAPELSGATLMQRVRRAQRIAKPDLRRHGAECVLARSRSAGYRPARSVAASPRRGDQ